MADIGSPFEYHSFVRGQYVYCTTWTLVVVEELVVRRQPDNKHDEYAVAVVKDEEVVGHVPREMLAFVTLLDQD